MKMGVLGLGSIGLRHARNLRSLGHDVIGYDIEEKRMKEFHGKVYTRGEIFDRSDAIVIATPTHGHHRDIIDSLGNNKFVFVEKPIVSEQGELERLQEFWNVKDAMVGYMLRFHPCVKAAKAWIDNGNIGKPIWAQFTCGQFNDKPDYLRDGVILNWSHEIDLALYLFGPAKVHSASVRCTNGKDDIADFVLEHDSGARSTIHLDYVTKNEIREAWIVGSEKNIGMDLLGRRNSMGKIIQEFGGKWDDDYLDEMAEWVKHITYKSPDGTTRPSPLATGEDGLRVLKICLELRKMAGLE